MTTATATRKTSTPKVQPKAKGTSAPKVEVPKLESLIAAFKLADTADTTAADVIKAAKANMREAQTLMARNAYRVATHPEVLTPRTRKAGINASGAAEKLDFKRVSLLPYIEAGRQMHDNADHPEWGVSVSRPTEDEIKFAVEVIRAESNKAREAKKTAEKGNAEQGGADTGITGDESTPKVTEPTFAEVIERANSLLATAEVMSKAGVEPTEAELSRFIEIMAKVQNVVAGE